MESIKRFEYCLKNITCAKVKSIDWIKQPGVHVSCNSNNTCVSVSFADDFTSKKCVTLLIQCDTSDCKNCEPLVKDICFCENGSHCGPCSDCNAEGVCVDRCEGKICNESNDTCVECTPGGGQCPGDQECQGGKCKCPPDKPIDLGGGRCGSCVSKGDCEAKYGKCAGCEDNQCVVLSDCGSGVCDPTTGNCEECNIKSDCDSKGPNMCCIDKKCVCCQGYVYSPSAAGCVPKPPCDGPNQCPLCEECVAGSCIPRKCPGGQVCVDLQNGEDGTCTEKCDCNNPASCTSKGKVCKNINGTCVCISCGSGCSSGCMSGCHCEGTACVVDKCNGSCSNGAGCGGAGTGCGCDETTKKCVDCSKLNCASGECDKVLGCGCIGNDCGGTGTRCLGGCDTRNDCGVNCTCYKGKCVPCDYFSCNNLDCSNQEGCKCTGSSCDGDPDATCKDTLDIVKIDATCDIEGHLTKDRCCTCPVITSLLKYTSRSSIAGGIYSGTHDVKLTATLFKGNNIESENKLKNTANPNIADNETASAGSLRLQVVTHFLYSNGSLPEPRVVTLTKPITGEESVDFDVSLWQINGKPISSEDGRRVSHVDFILQTDSWTFPNSCVYTQQSLGSFQANSDEDLSRVSIQGVVSNTSCRNPLFVWHKSGKKIRTVYVPLDTATGKYIDPLPAGSTAGGDKYEESCNDYTLKVDCSCQSSISKKIVFCKPTDFSATIIPGSCGEKALISGLSTCHANETKDYQLFVNGTATAPPNLGTTFRLPVGNPLPAFEVTKKGGITSIELKLVCDTAGACQWKKTFNADNIPDLDPTHTGCEVIKVGGVDVTKIKYVFNALPALGVQNILFEENTGTDASPIWTPLTATQSGNLGSIWSFLSTPGANNRYTVKFACGDHTGFIKKNCCNSVAPTFTGSCDAIYAGNLKGTDLVTNYELNFLPIGKEQLAGLNLGTPKVKWTYKGNSYEINKPSFIGYKPADSSCPYGQVVISSANCCDSYSINPNTSFVGTEGNLYLFEESFLPPLASGETVSYSINSGASVPYTIGSAIPLPTNKSEIKIDIKRSGCQIPIELIIPIGNNPTNSEALPAFQEGLCDITDITIVEDECKYKVTVPEVDCACKNGAFIPTITAVYTDATVDLNSGVKNIIVQFNGSFFGFDPEIGNEILPLVKTGKIIAKNTDNGSTATLVLNNFGSFVGYKVALPCVLVDMDPVFYNFNYHLLNPGSLVSNMRFCVNWPAGNGLTVTGLSVNNLTKGQIITGVAVPGQANCFDISSISLGSVALDVTLTLSDGSLAVTSLNDVSAPFWAIAQNVYVSGTKTCKKCANIDIYMDDVELNDGCLYSADRNEYRYEIDNSPAGNGGTYYVTPVFSTQVCTTDEAVEYVSGGGSIVVTGVGQYGEAPWRQLWPTNTRKVRVDFLENNTLIKRVYTTGGSSNPVYLDGTLPANIDGIEYGKTYKAKASCYCDVTEDMDVCLDPKVTSAITSCRPDYYSDGSSALRLVYSLKTCYANKEIKIYKAGTDDLLDTVTTDASGLVTDRTINLEEAVIGLEDDFDIFASFDDTCRGLLYHVSRSKYVLSWTRDCTNSPVTYDIVFEGTPTLEIVNGTGTVDGYSIVDIPNGTTIEFRGSIFSCVSKIYTETIDCTISETPTPTPTVTKTPTKSVFVTPSVTRSRTATPSLTPTNIGGGGIIIPSKTPTKTPTKTPSGTPDPSVTRSPGGSIPITPSVSFTRTITPTNTPSLSVSGSPGGSQTPTPSMTATPTPVSITRTPTPTASLNCTTPCTTGLTGAPACGGIGYCCGGTLVLDSSLCCNGSVISDTCNCCQEGTTVVKRITGFAFSTVWSGFRNLQTVAWTIPIADCAPDIVNMVVGITISTGSFVLHSGSALLNYNGAPAVVVDEVGSSQEGGFTFTAYLFIEFADGYTCTETKEINT